MRTRFVAVLLGLLGAACAALAQDGAAQAGAQGIASSSWTVQVAEQKRTRTLRIGPWLPGAERLDAWYGWSDRELRPVRLHTGQADGVRWIRFTTPSRGEIEATLTSPTTIEGTLTGEGGRVLDARLTRQGAAEPVRADGAGARALPVALGRVHLVYMGGPDCPPCRFWLGTDLPALKESPAFRAITFSKVDKVVKSPVPPAMFLPAEVRPLKAQLDAASAGLPGSAQVAVFVDGALFDYYHGTRTAEQVLAMLQAIEQGSPYPFTRCLRMAPGGACAGRP